MSDGHRWDKPGIPHRGWWSFEVIDMGEPCATCDMCGYEPIRYIHVLKHLDHPPLEVGCVCAENMTNDYVRPRKREQALRNRAARRTKWLAREWRTSQKGNPYLKDKGINLGVFQSPYHPGRWGYRIGGRFGPRTYPTVVEAKLALFDAYERTRAVPASPGRHR